MNSSRLAVPIAAYLRLSASLSIAREFGIGGIEVDGRYGIDLATLSDTGVRQIRKWLDDAGLHGGCFHFNSRRIRRPKSARSSRSGNKQAMLQAHRLGASVCRSPGDIPSSKEDPGWQVLVDVLSDLGRTGQQTGAIFCAEAGRAGPDDLKKL